MCMIVCYYYVPGSKSESTHSGRTLRGRGSCWGRGSRPPWPRHLHPAWNRTNERAGATARRMKRKITAKLLSTFYCSSVLLIIMIWTFKDLFLQNHAFFFLLTSIVRIESVCVALFLLLLIWNKCVAYYILVLRSWPVSNLSHTDCHSQNITSKKRFSNFELVI